VLSLSLDVSCSCFLTVYHDKDGVDSILQWSLVWSGRNPKHMDRKGTFLAGQVLHPNINTT